jgi:hypothetical protein
VPSQTGGQVGNMIDIFEDKIRGLLLLTLVSFILAAFFINMFLSTALASASVNNNEVASLLKTLLYAVAALFSALTAGLALFTSWLALKEAMSSGNGDAWKLSWALCIIFFFPLGLVVYFFIGRKWHKPRVRPKPPE